MMINSLKGARIGIVGAARSGIGASRLVHRLGGKALVSDIRNPDALRLNEFALPAGEIEIETGGHRRILNDRFDTIILSPGVVPSPEMLAAWREMKAEVVSEFEFAARCNSAPWIAVTGSNGKTTTCHLIRDILAEAGRNVKLVGNVGTPWSDFLPAESDAVFVVEVSSFQLEYASTVRPNVAVILNIFENHLDRHASIEEYADLKFRLVDRQTRDDWFVWNGDDLHLAARSARARSQIVRFGKTEQCEWRATSETVSCRTENTTAYSIRSSDIPLIGFHNRLNAAAAAAAAHCIGADFPSIDRALRCAEPVEHRLEFVRDLDGVRYINDSKSTNMVATRAALDSLDPSIILLFGGRPKKESYRDLNRYLRDRVRHIFLYGEARERVMQDIEHRDRITQTETLSEALMLARSYSQSGDSILLSPGCASFDQFENFEERGRYFKTLVANL